MSLLEGLTNDNESINTLVRSETTMHRTYVQQYNQIYYTFAILYFSKQYETIHYKMDNRGMDNRQHLSSYNLTFK